MDSQIGRKCRQSQAELDGEVPIIIGPRAQKQHAEHVDPAADGEETTRETEARSLAQRDEPVSVLQQRQGQRETGAHHREGAVSTPERGAAKAEAGQGPVLEGQGQQGLADSPGLAIGQWSLRLSQETSHGGGQGGTEGKAGQGGDTGPAEEAGFHSDAL